jgi:hypothetical protein
MTPYISYTERSALIEKDKLKVYYGQIDDISEEYCLVIWKSDKEIFRKTNSQLLEISNGEGIKDLLIAGLASYLK